MHRAFVELSMFSSKWKSFGLTDDNLRELQIEILSNPKCGVPIRGTGGVRKLRYALPGRGKSGSLRIIYVDFQVYERIYLLTAYTKGEKDNLTMKERNDIKKLVSILEQQLKK